MNKSTIFITILIVLLVIVVGMYFYTSGGQPSPGDSLLSAQTQDSGVGVQELALRRQVESIRIDPKFFSSAVYKSLTDYGQPIPDLKVGRSNPFAPIPGIPSPFTIPNSAVPTH